MAEQGRRFCGILYPDAENYDCSAVLETIKAYFDEWAFILHDMDVLEDTSELKKPHYHWVGGLKNPAQISTVVNRLEIPANYVEYVRKRGGKDNWKGAVRYLVHDSNPDKFQYSVESVVSNFDIYRFLSNKDDVMQIQRIIGFIDENPNCTLRSVYDFAVKNGCYSELRRAQTLIKDILKEMRGKEVV